MTISAIDGENLPSNGRVVLYVSAALLFASSFGMVLFGSPLFRVLGFEYAAVSSVLLSLVVGILVLMSVVEGSASPKYSQIFRRVALLSAIPLFVSLLSALFVSNCALWDGIIFYLEIPMPAVLIAATFAAACGLIARSRTKAVFLYIGIWLVTLFLSFLPGYFNPQIFTYGWQYGFFPGFVWDDTLTLTWSYAAFQLGAFCFAFFMLQIVRLRRSAQRSSIQLILSLVLAGLIVLTVAFFSDGLRIQSSHKRVEKFLAQSIQVNAHTMLRFAKGNLSPDEQRLIKGNVLWYLHTIREQMGLRDTTHDLTIYLYPTTDDGYEYIGTRTASIAKPWLGEVHITKGSLRSLKHELTHVLMAEVGNFPFSISWATGLTEGVAMSLEIPYDGLRSIDEQAARVVQTRPRSNVQEIMSFSGFASNSSFTSYTIAGSFSRYLLEKFGSARYLELYKTQDFDRIYHKSLSKLEQEWLNSLRPLETPMTLFDSLRTLNGVADTSVLYRPCLRRIGKLLAAAGAQMRLKHFVAADSLYAIVYNESGRTAALLGRLYAQIDLHQPTVALEILNKWAKPYSANWYTTLAVRASVEYLAGDSAAATKDFATLAEIGASEASLVDGYIYSKILSAHLAFNSAANWNSYFYGSWAGMRPTDKAIRVDALLDHSPANSRPYLSYLSAAVWIHAGDFSKAKPRLIETMTTLQPQSLEDSVIVTMSEAALSAITGTEYPPTALPAEFRGLSDDVSELRQKLTYLRSIGYSLDR